MLFTIRDQTRAEILVCALLMAAVSSHHCLSRPDLPRLWGLVPSGRQREGTAELQVEGKGAGDGVKSAAHVLAPSKSPVHHGYSSDSYFYTKETINNRPRETHLQNQALGGQEGLKRHSWVPQTSGEKRGARTPHVPRNRHECPVSGRDGEG